MANTKKPLSVMSATEAAGLRANIEVEKELLERATGTPEGASEAHFPAAEVIDLDVGAIQARIKRMEKALSAMSPEARRLTGRERQGYERHYQELTDWIRPKLLTMAEMGAFPAKVGDKDSDLKDSVYHAAIEKAAAGECSPQFTAVAREWKMLGRLLWPDDPDKSRLDSLRERGEKSGRHFGG